MQIPDIGALPTIDNVSETGRKKEESLCDDIQVEQLWPQISSAR